MFDQQNFWSEAGKKFESGRRRENPFHILKIEIFGVLSSSTKK
jgi:hypothetical protein